MNKILFSHRPQAGISVGVTEHEGQLYLAAALTNDGSSRNGVVHADRIDSFSRDMSRKIITGRLELAIAGNLHPKFAIILSTKMPAKEFLYAFRLLFKPDPYEADTTFSSILQYNGAEYRARMTANNIWDRVVLMANGIANHTLQENLAKTLEEHPEILDEIRMAFESTEPLEAL